MPNGAATHAKAGAQPAAPTTDASPASRGPAKVPNSAVAGLAQAGLPAPAAPLRPKLEPFRWLINMTVNGMVSVTEETFISDSDEESIVKMARNWYDRDLQWAADYGYQGTDFLDALLFALKMKMYKTDSFGTLWVDHWVNAYDQVWNTLEGPRKSAWSDLVAKSKKQKTAGARSGPPESAWGVIGGSLAKGGYGIAGGLATGMAGLVDAATYLPSKALEAAGVGKIPSLAKAVSEGVDVIGDELLFGKKEWSGGESLLFGWSARDISTGGGKFISALTTLGAGAAAHGARGAAAARTFTTLGVLQSIQGFETALNGLFDVLLKIESADPPLTWGKVVGNPDFQIACLQLGVSVAGALSKGQITKDDAAKQITGKMAKIGAALRTGTKTTEAAFKIGEVGARVAKIVEINARPGLTDKQREDLIAKEVVAIAKAGVDELAGAAAKVDTKRALEAKAAREAAEAEEQRAAEKVDSEPEGIELDTRPGQERGVVPAREPSPRTLPPGEEAALELDTRRWQERGVVPALEPSPRRLPPGEQGAPLELDTRPIVSEVVGKRIADVSEAPDGYILVRPKKATPHLRRRRGRSDLPELTVKDGVIRRAGESSGSMRHLSTIERPPALDDARLAAAVQRIFTSPRGILWRKLSRFGGPEDGQVSTGDLRNLKGNLGEILAEPAIARETAAALERHPGSQRFSGVYVNTGKGAKEFSDDIVATISGNRLDVHVVFEVKGRRQGGRHAQEQVHTFIEKNLEDGLEIIVGRGTDQEATFVYKPTAEQLERQAAGGSVANEVVGLARADRVLISPKGSEQVPEGTGLGIAPEVRTAVIGDFTDAEIQYLTRVVIESEFQ